MNAKKRTFQFQLEGYQVSEAVAALFHTILFLRSCRKNLTKDDCYVDNMCLFEDIDCDFFELTYVRCCSRKLKQIVEQEISKFCNQLLEGGGEKTGKISLEFYRVGKSVIGQTQHVWEIWTVEVEIVSFRTTIDRDVHREQVSDLVGNAILEINQAMSDNAYIPIVSVASELDFILDLRFENVQPYLFKILYETTPLRSSVGNVVWRLIFGNNFSS